MKRKINVCFKKIYKIKIFKKIILFFYFLMPIKNEYILFNTIDSKGYESGQKDICDELIKINRKIKIFWSSKNKIKDLPKKVHYVKHNSLRFFSVFSLAKVVVNNSRGTKRPPKKRKQFYIQLWHAGIPGGKKVEKDVEKFLPDEYVNEAKKDGIETDLMISGSRIMTKLFFKSFYYTGPVLECGFPAYELFFKGKKNIKNKVYNYFGLEDDTAICLYVPTFRNGEKNSKSNLDLFRLKNILEKKFKIKFAILIHLHPNCMNNNYNSLLDNVNYIDCTCYPDIYELMYSSFCAIGDYSCADLEIAFQNKPVFKYIYDYFDYIKIRGFYIELNRLPFTLSYTMNDLEKNISEFDYDAYIKKTKSLFKNLKIIKSQNSSKTIAKYISEIIKCKEKALFFEKFKNNFIYPNNLTEFNNNIFQ